MRRSLTLLLALQSLACANLGDWKLWTSVKSAKNAVVRGQTVLVATSGGVVEWSASRSKQRVFTTLDGLPEINIISVLADDAGAIWAVGQSGRLAKLAPGSSTWETTGSYAASNWSFTTAATAYWKDFLILGGNQGLSLFSTKSKVAMDNISSIQGKTVKFSSALVVNDTLWVGTDKGTAYCAPDEAGWAKAGTPGHYLTDPSRWKWLNDVPNEIMIRTETSAGHIKAGTWVDMSKGLGASLEHRFFNWKGGVAYLAGAVHGVEAPGGGFIVSSISLGPVHVNKDGTWKALEVDGSFPFDPLPYSVTVDGNGNLYALCQTVDLLPQFSRTALAKRPAGSYAWTLDTIKIQLPDSTGKLSTFFPSWDRGETKDRFRIGLDVDGSGRISTSTWVNSSFPATTGIFLSSRAGEWSKINHTSDTCVIELLNGGLKENSLGSSFFGARSREDGLWIAQIEHDEIPSAQPFPMRVHHLPKGSNGPLRCWDIPGVPTEFQTIDLLPLDEDLWLATKKGIKRIVKLRSKPSSTLLPIPSSPVGGGSGYFTRLERFPLDGKDWILAAGKNVLGLVNPATDSFFPATSGTDQSYTSMAVDSKLQIWAAGGSGIDIFQVVLQQDTAGAVAPAFEKIRRVTRVDGLPDNQIVDFRLDSASGRALIATENALVLWASPFRPVSTKLDPAKVKVWPNPIRLSQSRGLFVDGVSEQAEFSLVAQDGTLVFHLASGKQTTGMFQLELPPLKNLRPGLYFWTVKDGKTVARGPLLIGY